MKENEFNILYFIYENRMLKTSELCKKLNISFELITSYCNNLKEKELINEKGISNKGLDILNQYKVNNAIIIADKNSKTLIPLTLEKPKGLIQVKGEILIERQIKQLKKIGINDITIVLGYKKENFYFLEKKYNVKLFFNPEFSNKNNLYSLYLFRDKISNTYICFSDIYYSKNIFEPYIYQSYFSIFPLNKKGNKLNIISYSNGNLSGTNNNIDIKDNIMIGHFYIDKNNSDKFIGMLQEKENFNDDNNNLKKIILKDHIKEIPKIKIKTYPSEIIYNFNTLEELKLFDNKYIKNTNCQIIKNICNIFKCEEKDVTNFSLINSGLTNISFIFQISEKKYIYRHPGEGTEKIISRKHEKKSLELAKEIGVDPSYIYLDENLGWKISKYVSNARYPDYNSFEDSKRVIQVMKKLHNKNYQVDWEFKPWEKALKIEKLILLKSNIKLNNYEKLKSNVNKIYNKTLNDNINMRFCHCDIYQPNLLLNNESIILIDWEYAGNADPGCDLGGYIMDAMYTVEKAIEFIKEYLKENYNEKNLFHFLAYTAVISFHWTMWALYREIYGANLKECLDNYHTMAERFSTYLVDKYNL